jgi:hypothetical protein
VFVGSAVEEAIFVLEFVWKSNKESLLSDVVSMASALGSNLQHHLDGLGILPTLTHCYLRELAANSITALFNRLGSDAGGEYLPRYNDLPSHDSLDLRHSKSWWAGRATASPRVMDDLIAESHSTAEDLGLVGMFTSQEISNCQVYEEGLGVPALEEDSGTSTGNLVFAPLGTGLTPSTNIRSFESIPPFSLTYCANEDSYEPQSSSYFVATPGDNVDLSPGTAISFSSVYILQDDNTIAQSTLLILSFT